MSLSTERAMNIVLGSESLLSGLSEDERQWVKLRVDNIYNIQSNKRLPRGGAQSYQRSRKADGESLAKR
jgi:hypothetical protein